MIKRRTWVRGGSEEGGAQDYTINLFNYTKYGIFGVKIDVEADKVYRTIEGRP